MARKADPSPGCFAVFCIAFIIFLIWANRAREVTPEDIARREAKERKAQEAEVRWTSMRAEYFGALEAKRHAKTYSGVVTSVAEVNCGARECCPPSDACWDRKYVAAVQGASRKYQAIFYARYGYVPWHSSPVNRRIRMKCVYPRQPEPGSPWSMILDDCSFSGFR